MRYGSTEEEFYDYRVDPYELEEPGSRSGLFNAGRAIA